MPARNTLVQLLALYTDPDSHNAQRYRRTDGRTDDMMMPIADRLKSWDVDVWEMKRTYSLEDSTCFVCSVYWPRHWPIGWCNAERHIFCIDQNLES